MSITSQFRIGPGRRSAPESVTAHSSTHPRASDINITDIDLPSTLTAGTGYTATVTLTISTFASGVAYSDIDLCTPSAFTQGFDVQMGGAIPGVPGADFDRTCARSPSQAETELGREYDTEFFVQVVAPEENGDYSAQFTATGAVSGDVMDDTTIPVTVIDGTDPGDDDGNGDDDDDGFVSPDPPDDGNGYDEPSPCDGISSAFTRNECCPLNPSLTFRVPPYIGPEVDLERDAPNLCAAAPIGLVVLALIAWVLVNLSPARIVGDALRD